MKHTYLYFGYVFKGNLFRKKTGSLLGIYYRPPKMFQEHCVQAESRQASCVEATYL